MIRKEFIFNELKYRYPYVSGEIRHPALLVGRPLLLDESTRTPGAHIIICSADDLNSVTNTDWHEPLFLCIGTPDQNILSSLDVCVLPEGERPSAVLNFAQRLFDRLDEWLLRLKQTSETGSDVSELLETANEMLQNPILLFDSMGHVIACSGQIEAESEAIRLYNRFASAGKYENTVESGGGSCALFSELTVGGNRFVLFCPATERPIYGSDEVVFESLTSYIRLMLSERKIYLRGIRRSGDLEYAELTFRSLLSKDEPESQAVERLASIGWSETNSYCVVAAEPVNQDLREAHANEIRGLLESRLPDCCAFAEPPCIVAVFPSNYLNEAPLRTILASLSKDEGIRFGACEAYRGFSFLPQRLELAKVALSAAAGTGGVAFFADTAEEYAVSRVVNNTPRELFSLRSISVMAQSDREHGTRYLETIEQYVNHRFNAVKTASDLFIHRSTFLYRVERIKTQFGLDLESEDISLLHLLLSISAVKNNLPQHEK